MIFSKAEGPNLVRIFLTTNFNIFSSSHDGILSEQAKSNAIKLAKELAYRNITSTSRIQDVRVALINYFDDMIKNYQVEFQEFKSMIDAITESILDAFDDIIVPFLA